jgi:hypothetical protein
MLAFFLEVSTYFGEYMSHMLANLSTIFERSERFRPHLDKDVEFNSARFEVLSDGFEAKYGRVKGNAYFNKLDDINNIRRLTKVNKIFFKKVKEIPTSVPSSIRATYEDLTSMFYQTDLALYNRLLFWLFVVFTILYMLLKLGKFFGKYYAQHFFDFVKPMSWYVSDLFLISSAPVIFLVNFLLLCLLIFGIIAYWSQLVFLEFEILEAFFYRNYIHFRVPPRAGGGMWWYDTLEYRDRAIHIRSRKKIHTMLYKRYLNQI